MASNWRQVAPGIEVTDGMSVVKWAPGKFRWMVTDDEGEILRSGPATSIEQGKQIAEETSQSLSTDDSQ